MSSVTPSRNRGGFLLDDLNKGWVKLHRQILDNEFLMNDHKARMVFMMLLLLVDKKTGTWKGGRKQLADLCGLNARTLYDVSKRLRDRQNINIKSNNKYSVISICNWTVYQHTDQQALQQQTNNKPTTNQHSNKKKEVRSIYTSTYIDLHNQLCQLFGKNPNVYKLSDKRKAILKVRLKDSGEQNMVIAATAVSKSKFHTGDNDRQWVADPYWVFSSYEKTETWSTKVENQQTDWFAQGLQRQNGLV